MKRRYKIWYTRGTKTIWVIVMKTEKELDKFIWSLKTYKNAKDIDVEELKEVENQLTIW